MINLFALKFKSALDIFVSFILILILLPLLVICFVIIFLEDGFNPIFIQKRIGINGISFNMLKFRTMTPNSEHKGSGYYCYEGDPRITKCGGYTISSKIR